MLNDIESTESILPEPEVTDAFEKLKKNMPSIGFISRKKRIQAYITITKMAEYMITNDEINEEDTLFIFSLLMRKFPNFQKAAMMTALNLPSIGIGVLSPIGLKFILEIRKNLNLPSTHHTDNDDEDDENEDSPDAPSLENNIKPS